jgi:hypothetical protein
VEHRLELRGLSRGGRAELLVPPADLDALVGAMRVVGDEAKRNRIVPEGLRVARTPTLESEAERVARFIDVQARVSPLHEL